MGISLKTNIFSVFGQIYVSYMNFNSGNTQYFNQRRPQFLEKHLGSMTIKAVFSQLLPLYLSSEKPQPIQKTNPPHFTYSKGWMKAADKVLGFVS